MADIQTASMSHAQRAAYYRAHEQLRTLRPALRQAYDNFKASGVPESAPDGQVVKVLAVLVGVSDGRRAEA